MTGHNIAIFLDGTWNEPDFYSKDPTDSKESNVYKLFKACPSNETQHAFYIPGVGTDIRQGGCEIIRKECGLSNSPHWLEKIRGVLGFGLKERILEAYGIICSRYQQKRGDRIFIFGFSRGAFAARSLVNFIDKVGILFDSKREEFLDEVPENPNAFLNNVRKAYEIYENYKDFDANELSDMLVNIFSKPVINDQRDLWRVETHFLGVWDTVATMGFPSRKNEFEAARTEYFREAVPASVICVRHALAAHEFRVLFEPLMFWGETQDASRIEQRWFAGSHADVGGGYRRSESGLSIDPLYWICHEAINKNLIIDFSELPEKKGANSVLHLEGVNPKNIIERMQTGFNRKARYALRLAAIKRRLNLRILKNNAARTMHHANSNNADASVKNLLIPQSKIFQQAFFPMSVRIDSHLKTANRSLLRILGSEYGNVYDLFVNSNESYSFDSLETFANTSRRGHASLYWALSILLPSDLEKIYEFIAFPKDIRDHETSSRRDGPPLYARLGINEHIELVALAMVCDLEISRVDDAIKKLEISIIKRIKEPNIGAFIKILPDRIYWLLKVMIKNNIVTEERQIAATKWRRKLEELEKHVFK